MQDIWNRTSKKCVPIISSVTKLYALKLEIIFLESFPFLFIINLLEMSRVGFGIDNLKFCFRVYLSYPSTKTHCPNFECEENNSNTCGWGNVIMV